MANKKKKNSKKSNIASSSLLPARSSGEKPDIPFHIKTEINDENEENDIPHTNNDIRDLFSLIEASKNPTIAPQDTECSNHSISSTATELMDCNDGNIASGSQLSDVVENQIMPRSFSQVHVKTEPTEYQISHNLENFTSSTVYKNSILAPSESGVQELESNNHIKNSNEPLSPVINELDQKTSQDVTSNVTVCFKPEPTENNIELNNDSSHKETATKRKKDFEPALAIIRKKLKVEPNIDSENSSNENQSVDASKHVAEETIPTNNIQVKKEITSDDECSMDIEKDDNEIAVLPVPRVEKNVVIITLSDDEQTEDVNRQSSASTSQPKSAKKRNFSTDILRYFSVVSELDRYDCQTALTFLEKNLIKNTLEDFFPIVKKEKIKPLEIEKGDILFKKITESSPETECASISSNVDCTIPVSVSQYVNFPTPAAEPVWQDNNFPSPPTPQLPTLPAPPSFEKNLTLTPQLAAFLSMLNSNPGQLQEIIGRTQQIAMPSSNVATIDFPETPLCDPRFKKGLNLQNGSRTPASNVVNKHQVPSPILCNTDFPKSSTSYPISSKVPFAQLPNQSLQRIPEPSTSNPISPHEPLPNHNFQTLPNTTYSVPLQIPSTSLPKNDLKKLPIPSAPSVIPKSSIAFSNLPTVRDPRIASKQTAKFGPRKGVKELLLYKNVGKDTVTQHFETLILQWNPSWVTTQIRTKEIPPICDSYPNVGYSYKNEMAYYNTYVPLHLLHIWYNIYDCWVQRKGKDVNCSIQFVDCKDNVFKIDCSAELGHNDVWPKRDDILWCKHNEEEAFLLVKDVKKKSMPTKKKFKISLETLHDLKLQPGDQVQFCILLNIRTACMKIEALNSLDGSMKELVLKPEIYRDSIESVQLDTKINIKLQRNAILDAMNIDKARVVVVDADSCNIIVLITQVSYMLIKPQLVNPKIKNQAKVLIVLKTDELVAKLFKRLFDYKPVLAVRTKQIQLPEEYIKYTLEDRMERKEILSDILNDHHIFITAFSAFGTAEKAHLSKLKALTCIVEEAHMCTEVETALPLALKINKLLLLGNKYTKLNLPSKLVLHKYHISLFARLWKAKQML